MMRGAPPYYFLTAGRSWARTRPREYTGLSGYFSTRRGTGWKKEVEKEQTKTGPQKKKTKAKAKKGDDGGGATKNSVSSCSLVGIPSQPTPPQEIFSYNGRNLPGYAPSFIPQQWNNSDCGMFLLVYLRNILSLIRDEGEMVTKEDVQAKSIFRQNTWGSSEMWKKNNIILRLREHFQGVMGGFDMTGQ
mmetsp:Transcript_8432/g.17053  ORF Transcript_8432/g.17053 Transcript_8432/m.17053 type:complete len:189 (+) Transcript_8432:1087-1653(+)